MRSLFVLLLVFVAGCLSQSTTISADEISALSALRSANPTLQTAWTDALWNAGLYCNLQGVVCDLTTKPYHVVSLDLPVAGLVNVPSAVFSKLNWLLTLDISGNSIVEVLPSNISIGAARRSISKIDLSNNHFSGGFPNSLTQLKELIHLYLQQNQLSGSIPVNISSMASLWSLDLSSNGFSGSVPASIGLLPELDYLNLSRNALSGQLPSTLNQLLQLSTLDLSYNGLSGAIPDLSNLKDLRAIYLQGNGFRTVAPAFLSSYTGTFDLTGVYFYCPLPVCKPGINCALNNVSCSCPCVQGHCLPSSETCVCNGNFVGTTCNQCANGYAGSNCDVVCVGGLTNQCNNHGICSQGTTGDGSCACDLNFQEPDCAHCVPGWTGVDCTIVSNDMHHLSSSVSWTASGPYSISLSVSHTVVPVTNALTMPHLGDRITYGSVDCGGTGGLLSPLASLYEVVSLDVGQATMVLSGEFVCSYSGDIMALITVTPGSNTSSSVINVGSLLTPLYAKIPLPVSSAAYSLKINAPYWIDSELQDTLPFYHTIPVSVGSNGASLSYRLMSPNELVAGGNPANTSLLVPGLTIDQASELDWITATLEPGLYKTGFVAYDSQGNYVTANFLLSVESCCGVYGGRVLSQFINVPLSTATTFLECSKPVNTTFITNSLLQHSPVVYNACPLSSVPTLPSSFGVQTLPSDPTCPQHLTQVVTWNATDGCMTSSQISVSRRFEVIDTLPPTVYPPADLTLECTATVPSGIRASADDQCTPTATVQSSVNFTDSNYNITACTKVVKRTWRAWDQCGHGSAANQTLTYVDTTPPTISNSFNCLSPENNRYKCFPFTTLIAATDGCQGSGGVNISYTGPCYQQDDVNTVVASSSDCFQDPSNTQKFCFRANIYSFNDDVAYYQALFTVRDLCGNSVQRNATVAIFEASPDNVPPGTTCAVGDNTQ